MPVGVPTGGVIEQTWQEEEVELEASDLERWSSNKSVTHPFYFEESALDILQDVKRTHIKLFKVAVTKVGVERGR